MCEFFSFISDGTGKVFYFDAKQRRDANLPKVDEYDFDSHSSIAAYFLQDPVADDRVNKYEYSNGRFKIDQINVDDDSEQVKAWIFKFVKSKHFKDICLATCRSNGYALRYVPSELCSPELCLEACKSNGFALDYVPYELRTPEICLEACKSNGYSLRYVPVELRTPEICLAACKLDGWALDYVPYELRTPEICISACRSAGALTCVPDHIKYLVRKELHL